MDADAGYGLWPLVIVNTALFAVFAASFFHPRTGRDWRAMGALTAFLVALFTEMYGIPLTVYLLSGWLGSKIPGLSATHSGGHLFNDLIGWDADPHLSPFHLASYLIIGGGFWLIAAAWRVLQNAAPQRRAGDHRAVRAGTPPAVRRVPAHHDRVPAAVADHPDAGHVPDPAAGLHPAGAGGGA